MSLRKKVREFAAELISGPGEHKKSEIAAQFLNEHGDYAAEYLRELAEMRVAELIKEMCDEQHKDALPMFAGLPAAIAVAPGVVKATANCTLDDLGAGLENRRQNLQRAAEKFDAYGQSMSAFDRMRNSETETVGQCEARLRKQGQNST